MERIQIIGPLKNTGRRLCIRILSKPVVKLNVSRCRSSASILHASSSASVSDRVDLGVPQGCSVFVRPAMKLRGRGSPGGGACFIFSFFFSQAAYAPARAQRQREASDQSKDSAAPGVDRRTCSKTGRKLLDRQGRGTSGPSSSHILLALTCARTSRGGEVKRRRRRRRRDLLG